MVEMIFVWFWDGRISEGHDIEALGDTATGFMKYM